MDLRPYQRASLDALYASWRNDAGDGLIVLPTGAGKAFVIAALVREVIADRPEARIAIVTHTRELIAQNYRELVAYWPQAPAGIYSAGLNRRDTATQILFCGIQSVWNRIEAIGAFDVVVVDEAHLIPRNAETRYGRFLAALRDARPDLRVVGLTATPYRLDSGRLDEGEGRLFERIVYEANVGDLIYQGYLAPLICKATATALDVSGVAKRGGDYIPGALEAAVNQDWITRAAVEEMATFGSDRRAWLAFCAGVAHAKAVRDAVRAEGVSCEMVTGETGKRERDRIVRDFTAGRLRCLTSVGVLSTGFNVPRVDLIALLRPTQSTGLYVQQVGRALRTAPGKADALILDYAGLVRMHGPVDIVTARSAAAIKGRENEVRAKPCPDCGALIALNASTCEGCWIEPDETEDDGPSHEASAEDEHPILSRDVPVWRGVTRWRLGRHAASDSLEVDLHTEDGASHRVRIALEQTGYLREKAVQWWRQLGGGRDVPMTVDEALARVDDLSRPAAILIRANGRLSESISYRFPDGRTFVDTRRLAGAEA
ncbi:DEAD/DEAH box helicase [Methylobacterium sp. 77]|uniref:DEAD/DEAH box helicase n=1 Tax=Methylobacterium sp. 77 TaxID=1101192 RepID=UPI000368FA9D|nr:DEAD/DEAH box helicase [Methylobacterium sp. 77]